MNITVYRSDGGVWHCAGSQMLITPPSEYETTFAGIHGETRRIVQREPWGKLWIKMHAESFSIFDYSANQTVEISDGEDRNWKFYEVHASEVQWSDSYVNDPEIEVTMYYRNMEFSESDNSRRFRSRLRANRRQAQEFQKLDWKQVGF